ncbi:MAG: hypothetical protein JWL87_155 [Candidatus Adlerbacteria bacterium]|nr:hypothetical protein [Candidatus Adlerbacteria bacterium]
MRLKFVGYLLLGAALLVLLAVIYLSSDRSRIPLMFSPTQILGATWGHYKEEYLEPGTNRTLDKQRENVTTSEGQSYTMLRAVWQGDKETFDASWTWTKDNLLHDDDWLFAWIFGKRSDGSYGVLAERGGNSTASDADQDIALALIFAYARWQDPAYIGEARRILDDIWEKEVIMIQGKPYLAANDLEKFSSSETAIINPSYLAPYAYRIFAVVDSNHAWEGLIDTSYDVIGRSIELPLGAPESAGLAPDWVRINKATGELTPTGGDLTTNFGYDALRMPWRLALDYQWNKEERARETLSRMSFLSRQWKERGTLSTTYSHDGTVLGDYETPAFYGGVIGYFIVADKAAARNVYEQKLGSLYNPDTNDWKQRLSYYDDNWAWFGIGLYHNLLPNLSDNLPASAFLTP